MTMLMPLKSSKLLFYILVSLLTIGRWSCRLHDEAKNVFGAKMILSQKKKKKLEKETKTFRLPFLQILFLVSFEKSFLPITHDFVTFKKPEAKRNLFLRAYGQAALHRGCACTAHPQLPGSNLDPPEKNYLLFLSFAPQAIFGIA